MTRISEEDLELATIKVLLGSNHLSAQCL